MLKNSIMGINKITSIVHFNATETDGEFIFQQLSMICPEF
ncbi:PF07601 family protein [Leptospira interrogans str. HAI1594]|nr:PF07601 family protein [Leptospira interrogans str. HAI1594]